MNARPSVIVHAAIINRTEPVVHAAQATRNTKTDRWTLTTPGSSLRHLPAAVSDGDVARAVVEAGDAYLAMMEAQDVAAARFAKSLETIAQCHPALPGMEATP